MGSRRVPTDGAVERSYRSDPTTKEWTECEWQSRAPLDAWDGV